MEKATTEKATVKRAKAIAKRAATAVKAVEKAAAKRVAIVVKVVEKATAKQAVVVVIIAIITTTG